jgi:hypothetical protein
MCFNVIGVSTPNASNVEPHVQSSRQVLRPPRPIIHLKGWNKVFIASPPSSWNAVEF